MKYWVGIDIGKSGAIVIMDEKKNILTVPMPKVAKEINVHQIVRVLSSYIYSESGEELDNDIHVGIEDVHSLFGTGAMSNFQFGRSLGIIEGVIIALGLKFTKITPKVWQKELWQGVKPVELNTGKKTKDGNIKYKTDTKATSLLACQRLFPNLNLTPTERSKKPHDGVVDAVLICEYVRRKF